MESVYLPWLFVAVGHAWPYSVDKIKVEAVVVTKAELRRHMAAEEGDSLKPSTREELTSAYQDLKQPVYLVVRFLPDAPGHYWGEIEVQVDAMGRAKIPVALHYTDGWVEYFIPLSGVVYAINRDGSHIGRAKEGCPVVTTKWTKLEAK